MMIAAVKIASVLIAICTVADAVQLKIGIYNSIPDLANDQLASYKNLIQDGFIANYPSVSIDAVVDTDEYDPYGNLVEYLTTGNFDMLEIDTISLPGLVETGLVVPITDIGDIFSQDNTLFDEAKAAVLVNDQYYAYPTLVCGNFLIGLSPATNQTCDLRSGRDNYENFDNTLTQCEEYLLTTNYERLFGGKMNDNYGYYLPYLYIDGYIDIYGKDKAQEAVFNVINDIIDTDLCKKLTRYINGCDNVPGHNKCFCKFDGSYVDKSDNIYLDIRNQKTMLYFGFSEKLGEIRRDNPRIMPYAAISGPLGENSQFLQFTDALVISTRSWNNTLKRDAILDFVRFFASTSLRRAIMFGRDLPKPMPRYLLQANREAYTAALSDPIIKDIYWALQRGVHTPVMDDSQRQDMQNSLMKNNCVSISCPLKKEEL